MAQQDPATLYHGDIEQMKEALAASKEKLILQIIQDGDGNVIVMSPQEIQRRGAMEVYPSGEEVFWWDGVPRIRLLPPDIKIANGRLTISQPYEIIKPQEGDHEETTAGEIVGTA